MGVNVFHSIGHLIAYSTVKANSKETTNPMYHQLSRWRHQMETFSALLALCAGKTPVPGDFPKQRPVTRSLDVFFDLRPNKRFSKQSWGWWFETLSCSLWRHCNVVPGIHQWSWDSPHKGQAMWKWGPCDDVMMITWSSNRHVIYSVLLHWHLCMELPGRNMKTTNTGCIALQFTFSYFPDLYTFDVILAFDTSSPFY